MVDGIPISLTCGDTREVEILRERIARHDREHEILREAFCKKSDEAQQQHAALIDTHQEVERLRAVVDRQQEINDSVIQLAAESLQKRAHLRAALSVFADRANWDARQDCCSPQVWKAGHARPWTIAQEALVKVAAETCQPPPPCEPAGHAESRTDQFAAGGGDSYNEEED